MFLDFQVLKIKRAESPFYARLKRVAGAILTFHPPIPRVLDPVYSLISSIKVLNYKANERISVACCLFPVLRVKCVSIGKRLQMERVPHIDGPVRISLGDDVRLSGQIIIGGARVFPESEFSVGNRTYIGAGSHFAVAKSIRIGDDVLIPGNCYIFDYSGHPLDPKARIAGMQVDPEDVRPVCIKDRHGLEGVRRFFPASLLEKTRWLEWLRSSPKMSPRDVSALGTLAAASKDRL